MKTSKNPEKFREQNPENPGNRDMDFKIQKKSGENRNFRDRNFFSRDEISRQKATSDPNLYNNPPISL